MVPKRFFIHSQNAQGDHHVYASRTRFFPDELLGLFERTAWPVAEPVVERDDALGRPCQVGGDEADARVKLDGLPL